MLKDSFHHSHWFFLSLLILFSWFGDVYNLQIATKYYNMLKVINKDTKTIYEIFVYTKDYTKVYAKTPKQGQWLITRSSIFIVYFVYDKTLLIFWIHY